MYLNSPCKEARPRKEKVYCVPPKVPDESHLILRDHDPLKNFYNLARVQLSDISEEAASVFALNQESQKSANWRGSNFCGDN